MTQKIFSILFLSICFSISFNTYSNDAIDFNANIDKRVLELKALRSKILSKDNEIAIATTEAGLGSGDSEVRSLTLESAFQSKNMRVQTTALRWVLKQHDSLIVDIQRPNGPNPPTRYTFKEWRGLVLERITIKQNTDEILIRHKFYRGGHLKRGGIQLEFAKGSPYPQQQHFQCTLTAGIDTDGSQDGFLQMTGSIYCTYPSNSKHPAGGEEGEVGIRINLS